MPINLGGVVIPGAQQQGQQGDPLTAGLRAAELGLRTQGIALQQEQFRARQALQEQQLQLQAQGQFQQELSTLFRINQAASADSVVGIETSRMIAERLGIDPASIEKAPEDFHKRIGEAGKAINQCAADLDEGKISAQECAVEVRAHVDGLRAEASRFNESSDQTEARFAGVNAALENLQDAIENRRRTTQQVERINVRQDRIAAQSEARDRRAAERAERAERGRQERQEFETAARIAEEDPGDTGRPFNELFTEELERLRKGRRKVEGLGLSLVESDPFIVDEQGNRENNPEFLREVDELVRRARETTSNNRTALKNVLTALQESGIDIEDQELLDFIVPKVLR